MKHKRHIIYLAGFIFSLAIALMAYINSSFLSLFINEKLVGTVYALGSLASVLALAIVPTIFRKIGGYKFLMWAIALDALSVLLFAFSKNSASATVLFVAGFTLNILIYFSIDEFLEIVSKESSTGKTRGSYLALSSLAWIVSQFLLGTMLGGFSFQMIYFTSFTIMLILLAVVYAYFRRIPEPEYDKKTPAKAFRHFFKNKNLFRAYKMSFILQLFYSWMVIYTPIYLSAHIGFSWSEIGIIFSVMLLPFAIIPFPLGKYADKIGERKILMLGFLAASLATLLIFFIKTSEVWIWALVLFATRVGAASVEVATDTYFFKHIKPENEEFVGVYRSASPVAYILGPLFASIIFIFIPSFNFIYLILGAFMIYGIYLASTIRKNDI